MTLIEALKIVNNRRITALWRLDAALMALARNLPKYEDEMRRLVARRKLAVADTMMDRAEARRVRRDMA